MTGEIGFCAECVSLEEAWVLRSKVPKHVFDTIQASAFDTTDRDHTKKDCTQRCPPQNAS